MEKGKTSPLNPPSIAFDLHCNFASLFVMFKLFTLVFLTGSITYGADFEAEEFHAQVNSYIEIKSDTLTLPKAITIHQNDLTTVKVNGENVRLWDFVHGQIQNKMKFLFGAFQSEDYGKKIAGLKEGVAAPGESPRIS